MEEFNLLHEMRKFDWSNVQWRASLLCLPAVALSLLVGIALGHPVAGMVAAGGAQCVGFGSFQKPILFRAGPMVLATIGTALSAAVGEIAAGHQSLFLLLAMLWAFVFGMSGAISSPASWVGQQCCIFLIVSSSVPGSLSEAGLRGLGVLAGGALQTLIISLGWQFLPRAASAEPDPSQHPPGWQIRALRSNLTLGSRLFRYALRLTFTTAIAVVIYHKLDFPNAYWVPMTTIIILKPDSWQTHVRAILRLLGTIVGAALATGLAVFLRPSPWVLTCAVVAFIYFAYALQNVHYGVFAVFLTGYIAFLLAVGRQPAGPTLEHRLIATAIGGGLGMLAYAIHLRAEELRLLAHSVGLALSRGTGAQASDRNA